MPSKDSLMLRSACRARLEARTISLQLLFRRLDEFADSLSRRANFYFGPDTCPGSAATCLRIVSFPELRGAPSDGGGDALGGDNFAEPLAELGLRRVERPDDVEPGIERGAEAGGIGAAVDRALCRIERFRGNQRQPLRPPQARLAQLGERHDAVDHAELERRPGVDRVAEIEQLPRLLVANDHR